MTAKPSLSPLEQLADTCEPFATPPHMNPFMRDLNIPTRRATEARNELAAAEISAQALEVSRVKFVDKDEFTKVFAAALRSGFGLGIKAQRMWWIVQDAMNKQAVGRDEIMLPYAPSFKLGTDDEPVKVSKTMFYDGLAELRAAGFLAKSPRGQSWYWVNPRLGFNGDRVRFVNEFVLREGKHAGAAVLYPRAQPATPSAPAV